jgi:hypothetical protein
MERRGWQIIDLQASQCGSRDDVRFTTNLASAIEGLAKSSNWDEKKAPSEAAAHLRERIVNLLADRDVWWDMDAGTEQAALAAELLAGLRRVGIPWLEARAGLERVLSLNAEKPQELGWHDLRKLPTLLTDAGHEDAAPAVRAEAERRGSK